MRISTKESGIFWNEAFNSLQTHFRMCEYMASGLSLCFEGVCLDLDEMWGNHLDKTYESWYGPSIVVVDALIEKIAEDAGVPYRTAFDGFAKAFQTKSGRGRLEYALEHYLGSDLYARTMAADTGGDEDNGSLVMEILEHIKAHPDNKTFAEHIITDPR